MAINSLSASSYGLAGLVSGINTEEVVQKLLTGTQSKIDKANQQKSVLQYKQTMYRDVASKLLSLQKSFLDYTSKTNLMSSTFYSNMSASLITGSGASAAFSVIASSSAKQGSYSMDAIKQLASAYTEKTQSNASGNVLGTLDRNVAQRLLDKYSGGKSDLTITVGSDTVTLPDAAVALGGKQPSAVVSALNTAFQGAGVAAEAKFVNNKLQIVATDSSASIKIEGSDLGLAMIGGKPVSATGTYSSTIDTSKYLPSFDVNVDGKQHSVSFGFDSLQNYISTGNASGIVNDLNTELNRVFGNAVSVSLTTDASGKTALSFDNRNTSQKLTVSGDATTLGALGLTNGMSNKLNTAAALKNQNFATTLQGNRQSFTINGVEFSYTSDVSLKAIIDDINGSKAGVKISYVEAEDRFVIQRSEVGDVGYDPSQGSLIDFEQTEGNLMSVLFGAEGSMSVTTSSSLSQNLVSSGANAAGLGDGGKFVFNVGGSNYTFDLTRDPDVDATPYTLQDIADKLNDAFASRFGTMLDGTQSIEVSLSGGEFVINSNSGAVVTAVDSEDTTLLGFAGGQSTKISSGSSTLADAGINFGTGGGITVNFDVNKDGNFTNDSLSVSLSAAELNGKSLDEISALFDQKFAAAGIAAADRPTIEFDENTAAFRVMGVDIPMEIVVDGGTGGTKTDSLFGTDRVVVGQVGDDAARAVTDKGNNAIFVLDGVEMERTSNTFTIDGMTFTLNGTTYVDPNDPSQGFEKPTQIAINRDTDKIVDTLVDFLTQYNELVDYINGLYKADPTYKDYPPLTSDQKASMSDREVELWEEKSREGLLRGDRNLEKVLSSMRSVMYSKPSGSSIAIYDLGITTSFYTNDGNLNPKSIEDLRAAVESDPEAVRNLFTGTDGIMTKLNETINGAAKSSFSSPGYLVSIAGSSGTVDTQSSIYKQIKEIDKQLDSLEDKYWSEYNRYWKQFNSMEQMIQQMNTQSSWLSQLG